MNTDNLKDKPAKGDSGKDLLSRVVHITGTIDDSSAQQCIQSLLSLAASDDSAILMVVNSPGGSTSSMFAIHDAIGLIPNRVYAVVIGHALSSAADLIIMQPKGNRLMTPNSTIMIHGVRTSYSRGTLSEIENHVERGKDVERRIGKAILQNTNLTKKRMMRLMRAEQFINAKAAMKWRMVDAVIEDINSISGEKRG